MISLDSLKTINKEKVFTQSLLQPYDVYNEDLPTGRVYVLPDGTKYPSVTTFLGKVSDKDGEDWYQRWVDKMGGPEKAARESARAADRGSGVHLALEHLVSNDPRPDLAGDYIFMYEQLEKIMKASVDNIRGSEIALYSHLMKLAGRVDLIADYNGVLSIIDFKTSNNFKNPDWITNYFLQCTCYQLMLKELYGLSAEKIVVLVSVEKQERPQIFIREPKEFYFLLSEKLKEFRYIQEQEAKKAPISMFDMF